MTPTENSPEFLVALKRNRITLGAFLALTAFLGWANYAMVAPYLLAVLMGTILAILFRAPFNALARRINAKVAAGTVVLGIALLILTPLCVFVTMATAQGIEAAKKMVDHPTLTIDDVSEKVTHWKPAKILIGNAAAVEAKIREVIKKVATAAPAVVFGFFGGVPEFLLQAILALVACFFLLLDGPAFVSWLRERVPLDPEVRGSIFTAFRETAVSTTLATLAAATMQTAIVTVGFIVLQVPSLFLAAGLTFIAAWVPLVGSSPVWLSASAYLFFQGSPIKGFLMIGFGCLTAVSDNLIYPFVLKGRTELHPLVSLVAIFGGIQLFGILGVFVGPILAALFVAMLQIWPKVAERFGILKSANIVTAPQTANPPSPIIQQP